MPERDLQIITSRQLKDKVPYSFMHIWRLEKEGKFPKRLKLGPNRVGWLLSEVDDWIRARAAERNQ